jgi:hypothetical protein
MSELDEAVKALQAGQATLSWGGRVFTANTRTDINHAIVALGKLIQVQDAAKQTQAEAPGQRSYEQVLERMQQIDNYRKSLEEGQRGLFEQPKQDAQAMSTAVGDMTLSTSNAVAPALQLASYWKSIAADAQLAAQASSQASAPQMRAHGGPMRYLASGGRGTDTIPAMLSKGEMVINAQSSRQFASQLTAINAGSQPVYRESGGTTTTVGDVSINVTEAQSSKQTAREVMSAFRREMRRGSGRL